MVRSLAACILFGLGLAPLAAAGDLKPTHVSEDARWVAHVDIAGLFASDLLAALEEHGLADLSDLDEVEDELGLDARTDLAGITVYGTTDDPENAVALIHTTSRIEKAMDRLRQELSEERVERDGLAIHRWSDKDGHGDAVYSYLARRTNSDERILVLAPNPDQVVMGVDVLRGEAGSMADGGADRLGGGPSEDALIYVSTGDMLQSVAKRLGATSRVVPLVRTAVVEIGEFGGRDYIDVRVGTDGSAETTQIVEVIRGAQALATIVAAAEPEVAALQPLLAGLRVDTRDDTVHLRFEQEVETLVRLARNGHDAGEDAWEAFAREPAPEEPSGTRTRSKTDWQ